VIWLQKYKDLLTRQSKKQSLLANRCLKLFFAFLFVESMWVAIFFRNFAIVSLHWGKE
jgi:hypothetical protein